MLCCHIWVLYWKISPPLPPHTPLIFPPVFWISHMFTGAGEEKRFLWLVYLTVILIQIALWCVLYSCSKKKERVFCWGYGTRVSAISVQKIIINVMLGLPEYLAMCHENIKEAWTRNYSCVVRKSTLRYIPQCCKFIWGRTCIVKLFCIWCTKQYIPRDNRNTMIVFCL
jgi:hypothetical protein